MRYQTELNDTKSERGSIMSIQEKEEYASKILWDVYGEIAEIIGEEYMPEYMDYEGMTYNPKLKRVIARCAYRRMTCGPSAYRFEVSEVFFKMDYDTQTNILAHEWIHAILVYNGRFEETHGAYFKKIMNKLNANGFNISIYADFDKLKENGVSITSGAKYILKCEKCGKTWDYYRMCKTVKYASRYNCPDCGGSIIRVF